MPPRFYSLWAINSALDREALAHQLTQFKHAGLDGVVWHPRFYPGEPPYLGEHYLELLSATILRARDLGLAFWIYDENGWPSGTTGGETLSRFPELRQEWAGLYRERPAEVLHAFERDGATWFVGRQRGAGVDYLNPALASRFLELTHERYARGLVPEAWAHVEAIFCDEPEFGLGHAYDALPPDGAIPWTPDLPELFAKTFGERLELLLPDLFFTSTGSKSVRIRFWELLRDRFCSGFLEPIDAWCRQHGKRFTAHIKGEEHPLFQVPMVGSCSAVFRHLSLPGIDALERFPGNDFFPRQLVSAAQQFGDGCCMAEAFGGAGWGAKPEDLERYLLWLGKNGVTDFVMHLSQFELNSAAIRDWPPSQPLHVSWREAYPHVLRRVREQLRSCQSDVPADTLLLSPHRGVMSAYEPRELLQTNIHNAASYPDSPAARINREFLEQVTALASAGRRWHVTDEATFEKFAERAGAGVKLGRQFYNTVISARGSLLNAAAQALISALPASKFVRASQPPEVQAGRKSRIAMRWSTAPIRSNSVLLERAAETDGSFTALVEDLSGVPLEVFTADPLASLEIDGRPVQITAPRSVLVPGQCCGFRRLRMRFVGAVVSPFVWLKGAFKVGSRTPFEQGPERLRSTRGPFFLSPQTLAPSGDWIEDGFPFSIETIVAETDFVSVGPARTLTLVGIAADAARVSLDGHVVGWIWGPDWRTPIDLGAGPHHLRIDVAPSTFNHYGPHRYYLGDRHVISPDQFVGRKNFADPSGAPETTLGDRWHFRMLRLPTQIELSD